MDECAAVQFLSFQGVGTGYAKIKLVQMDNKSEGQLYPPPQVDNHLCVTFCCRRHGMTEVS